MIGILISIGFLWWALHDVSLSELAEHARHTRVLPLVAGVAFATLAFPLRTIRWRYLLQHQGEKLPFVPLWHATAIGFMANNLLPARAGEVARVYAAGKLTRASYSASFASVAIERVFDGLSLATLMTIAVAAGGFDANSNIAGISIERIAKGATGIFLLALLIAGAAVHWSDKSVEISTNVLTRILPDKLASRISGVVVGLFSGLDSLKSPSRLAVIVFWSLAVWIVNGAGFWLAFYALGIDVPWTGAYLLQAVIAFGIVVPSSPGYFGPFEAFTKATLSLYGVPVALSVSYAVIFHLASFIPITLLGLYSLSRAHIHISDLTSAAEPVRSDSQ